MTGDVKKIEYKLRELARKSIKIFILVEKGVSGVPYLRNRAWKFCKMHLILKHFRPLIMRCGQNSWKLKSK